MNKNIFLTLLKTVVLVCLAILTACTKNYSLAEHNSSLRINPNLQQQHFSTESELEEYINRIAKKLIMVSNNPEQKTQFKVHAQTNIPINFVVSNNHRIVTLSHSILAMLNDEAQLAAILCQALAYNSTDNILTNLERAGYDLYALYEIYENPELYKHENPQTWQVKLFPSITQKFLKNLEKQITKRNRNSNRGQARYKSYIVN